MVASIFVKSVRDRWVGMVVAMAIVGGMLIMGMAAYSTIDLSVYTELPEAMRSIMGIPADADAAALSYGVLYGLMGAMTLAGLAVSIGASLIAGEERDGTIGLLLGNPQSRREVLVAKSAALVGLVTLGAVLAWAGALVAPVLLGVDIGSSDVVAVIVHMWANAMLFGFFAVAIGALTGNRALSSGIPAGVMVLSYFLVGTLALVESLADLTKFLPWYWFDGHGPVNNGIDGGYLSLQLGATIVLAVAAWLRVDARDLRSAVGSTSLLERLRENPVTRTVVERLAGSSRVSRVFAKTASENQVLLVITAVTMFSMMGLMMGPMYAAISDTLARASASLPEALLALAGGGDMSTPEGWYQLETFGLMAPIAVIVVTASLGAKALAGEEQRRTMGLLLANPVPRSRVVLEKAGAMVVHAAVVGVATFLGVVGGSLLGGLGMDVGNIAATSLLATLLGLLFGAIALALSAGTGRTRVAVWGATGVATFAWALNAIFSIAESLAGWRRLSPFEWAQGHLPLENGMSWGAAGLFTVLIAALVGLAVVLFERRDLHNG